MNGEPDTLRGVSPVLGRAFGNLSKKFDKALGAYPTYIMNGVVKLMTIEKATCKDFNDLSNLYFELTDKNSDLNKMELIFNKMVNNEFYYLLVARNEQNKAIATAMGVLCFDLVDYCNPFMLIENVIVSKDFRGQGVGKMLMLELESIAYKNQCSLILLVSGTSRKKSHIFYESLGYSMEKGFKKKLTYIE